MARQPRPTTAEPAYVHAPGHFRGYIRHFFANLARLGKFFFANPSQRGQTPGNAAVRKYNPRMAGLPMRANLVLLVLLAALSTGCVRRTIMITSQPPGVLIWINDREVGRTPVDVDFEYYGVYDVRLELAGYEPMMTSGKASAPWWDKVGADFFAELVPADLHSEVRWHYVLTPLTEDRGALIERAAQLRLDLSVPETDDAAADPPPDDVPDD